MSERITKTPGVCGGDACIAGTRIPVWLVTKAMKSGADIGAIFPTLTTDDFFEAGFYYATNTDEIDAAIAENDGAHDPGPTDYTA